jgi:hypothetical protein
MKVSEHIINQENGVEYYKIYFEAYADKDITYEKHKEIQLLIEKNLYNKNDTK